MNPNPPLTVKHTIPEDKRNGNPNNKINNRDTKIDAAVFFFDDQKSERSEKIDKIDSQRNYKKVIR